MADKSVAGTSSLLHQSLRSVDLWRCRQVRYHAAAQHAPVVRLGAHFCLSGALARLELGCVFLAPLVRLEDLSLTIAAKDFVYRGVCRSRSALPSLRE